MRWAALVLVSAVACWPLDPCDNDVVVQQRGVDTLYVEINQHCAYYPCTVIGQPEDFAIALCAAVHGLQELPERRHRR